jgi:hypothetical protein
MSCGIMVLTSLPITLQSIKDLSLFGEAKVMEFFKSKNFVEKNLEIFQQTNYTACFSFTFLIWISTASSAMSKDSSKDLVLCLTKISCLGI